MSTSHYLVEASEAMDVAVKDAKFFEDEVGEWFESGDRRTYLLGVSGIRFIEPARVHAVGVKEATGDIDWVLDPTGDANDQFIVTTGPAVAVHLTVDNEI